MATITSAQSGNWSDLDTWVGGVVPTLVDDVILNTAHIVNADVDVVCNSLKRIGGTGRLSITDSRNITVVEKIEDFSTVPGSGNNLNSFILITSTTPSNTINITASELFCGFRWFKPLIRVLSPCVCNVNGDLVYEMISFGVSATDGCDVIRCEALVNLSVSGELKESSNSFGTTPTRCSAIALTTGANGSTVNINGIISGSGLTKTTNENRTVRIDSLNTVVNIVGLVYGATQAAVFAQNNGCIVNLDGVAVASNQSQALKVNILNISGILTDAIIYSSVLFNKISVISNLIWNTLGVDDTLKPLYTADELTGYPLPAKVENGTVYGPSSEFEGTLEPVNVNTQQLAEDLITELFNNGTPWATPQFVASAITAITPSP